MWYFTLVSLVELTNSSKKKYVPSLGVKFDLLPSSNTFAIEIGP